MDRYHSIVWPMVSYHWKTIESNGCQTKNHRKTIEPNGCQSKKPSGPMVDRPKTIGETIDTDGCFQTIHSMAMVTLKTIEFSQWQQSQSKNSCLGRLNKVFHHIDQIYQIGFLPSKPNSFRQSMHSKPHWLPWKYTFRVPISAGKGPH